MRPRRPRPTPPGTVGLPAPELRAPAWAPPWARTRALQEQWGSDGARVHTRCFLPPPVPPFRRPGECEADGQGANLQCRCQGSFTAVLKHRRKEPLQICTKTKTSAKDCLQLRQGALDARGSAARGSESRRAPSPPGRLRHREAPAPQQLPLLAPCTICTMPMPCHAHPAPLKTTSHTRVTRIQRSAQQDPSRPPLTARLQDSPRGAEHGSRAFQQKLLAAGKEAGHFALPYRILQICKRV